ncbi:hypothetical protein ACT3RP_09125 [Halomonas sp. AOP5-B2-8]
MSYENLLYLPHKISCLENAEEEFRLAFSSKESERHEGIVYFFLSEKPISRVLVASRILYIGKTNTSLRTRYFRYSKKFFTNRSGEFYSHIIKKLRRNIVCIFLSNDPKTDERKYFREYLDKHLEYPPKSKIRLSRLITDSNRSLRSLEWAEARALTKL